MDDGLVFACSATLAIEISERSTRAAASLAGIFCVLAETLEISLPPDKLEEIRTILFKSISEGMRIGCLSVLEEIEKLAED